jgi:hypothetical protein
LCPSSPLFIVTDSLPGGKTSNGMKLIVHIRPVMSLKFVEMPSVVEMTLCLSICMAYSLCVKGQGTQCWSEPWLNVRQTWRQLMRAVSWDNALGEVPRLHHPGGLNVADGLTSRYWWKKTVVLLVNRSRGEGGKKKVFRQASQLWPAYEYDVGLST